jgi:hypothetical protein
VRHRFYETLPQKHDEDYSINYSPCNLEDDRRIADCSKSDLVLADADLFTPPHGVDGLSDMVSERHDCEELFHKQNTDTHKDVGVKEA